MNSDSNKKNLDILYKLVMKSNQNYLLCSPIMEKKQTDLNMASLLKRKSIAFFNKLQIYKLISYLIIPTPWDHKDERNLYFISKKYEAFKSTLQ